MVINKTSEYTIHPTVASNNIPQIAGIHTQITGIYTGVTEKAYYSIASLLHICAISGTISAHLRGNKQEIYPADLADLHADRGDLHTDYG